MLPHRERNPKESVDIVELLEQPSSYAPVFDRLRKLAHDEPHQLSKDPVLPDLTLSWILNEERRVTRFLVRTIRRREIISTHSELHQAMLDKLRIICSQSWPQRILQAALSLLVGAQIEPRLSGRLFSFRKGMGHHRAIHELAGYLAEQTADGGSVFVCRRDIKQYDQTIRPELVRSTLEPMLSSQQPFFWELFESFLQPRFADASVTMTGIPMGFYLTPIVENVYLASLDSVMESVPGLFYIRYGDDLVFAHRDSAVLRRALGQADETVRRHNLEFHQEKRADIELSRSPKPRQGTAFVQAGQVEYLGLDIYSDGTTFLTEKKLKELQRHIGGVMKIAYQTTRRMTSDRVRILDSLIQSLDLHLRRELRHPYMQLVISSTTSVERVRKLDLWLAKQPLRLLYGSGHDRVFRNVSYGELRRRGLRSLLHLQRTERHR